VDPRGESGAALTELSLDQSAVMAKGCVRKEFHGDVSVPTTGEGEDIVKEKQKKETLVHATTLFQELLAGQASAESITPAPARVIASSAQCEAIAAHIETLLGRTTARVLVLTADGPPSESVLVRSLLQRSFSNLFTLQSLTTNDHATDGVLFAEAVKLEMAPDGSAQSSSKVFQCHSTTTASVSGEDPSYRTTILPSTDDQSSEAFSCIVDLGFLHRSLRNQPKKTSGLAFQRLVQLALSYMARNSPGQRLVTISPRKDWRKADFLANERLSLAFSTTAIAADPVELTGPLYLYACRSSTETAPTSGDQSDGKEAAQSQKKQRALQLKTALERDFAASLADSQIEMSSLAEANARADRSAGRIKVRGTVQHQRRFTTGPSFFSIASSTGKASSFRDHVQVSMDPQRLARWSGDMSLDAVFRLLHKSDLVECVGEMTRNAQQQPMLQLDALRFLESEFQAYE
jgi:hypothetical protein